MNEGSDNKLLRLSMIMIVSMIIINDTCSYVSSNDIWNWKRTIRVYICMHTLDIYDHDDEWQRVHVILMNWNFSLSSTPQGGYFHAFFEEQWGYTSVATLRQSSKNKSIMDPNDSNDKKKKHVSSVHPPILRYSLRIQNEKIRKIIDILCAIQTNFKSNV